MRMFTVQITATLCVSLVSTTELLSMIPTAFWIFFEAWICQQLELNVSNRIHLHSDVLDKYFSKNFDFSTNLGFLMSIKITSTLVKSKQTHSLQNKLLI